MTKGNSTSFKGATTKVKPRLTWFEKKKNMEHNGNRFRWQNADNGKTNL
jgi:hypothetical protein